MDPTSTVRIATGNVRIPHEEFLTVWTEASRREAEQPDDADWYVRAVVQTCRWMAAVPLRTALCGGLPRSPVTQRGSVAGAELVEAESQAARQPDRFSPTFAARPGWIEGVPATFEWAWHRQGPPPVEVP